MPKDDEAPQSLTRRQLFAGATMTAAATAAISLGLMPRVAHASKVDKKAAGYQSSPKNGQKCADCNYYQGNHTCKLVAGDISPHGWCTYFAPKG